MDVKEYDEIVRFFESKDSEQRNWPRDVLESKDGKDAKRAYREKCEGLIPEDGLLFKTKRRKKLKGRRLYRRKKGIELLRLTRRLDCLTPFTKIQQAVTLEFIKRTLYYTL